LLFSTASARSEDTVSRSDSNWRNIAISLVDGVVWVMADWGRPGAVLC
jgi:hypothetical protein